MLLSFATNEGGMSMPGFSRSFLFTLFALAMWGNASAAMSVLSFGGETNGTVVDQAYGDRLAMTPNVVVSYGPGDQSIAHWDFGYGDLEGILYSLQNAALGVLEVTLSADPGYLVNLTGFDLGGWERLDWTIDLVEVRADGVPVFAESNASIEGTNGHSSFDFPTGIVGRDVLIRFDAGNLGSEQDNIGIDNIAFSQAPVPLPASVLLFGSALLGLAGHRRLVARRRN
ncbi:MAG: PEP-CTERM sorting domain-containing protein [Pseudomonadota bacterium]